MHRKHWLGILATLCIAAAVVLAAVDGRTAETSVYLVILAAIVGTNATLWRRNRRAL